jgi:signal transduction histidine kinase
VTSFNPANFTILVVAHTDETQDFLLDYLRGYGYKVLHSTDGETALDVAQHAHPALILLDVILPGLDGFETCRRLKNLPATADIPVIFLTSQTSTVDKVRGFALGAVDYIAKPIQSEEVLARLKTHLTLQDLQHSLTEQNRRLQQEIAEREALIAELDAFAHTVAHDLKNPLGVTVTQAQFLRKFHHRMTVEEFEENLELVLKNGHKMNNIIYELLLLSSVRIEDVEPEPFDMADVLDEALDRLSFLIEEYEAHVIVPGESTWPTVLGYAPWIEEVWINYLSNAIKYGGQPPHIEMGAVVQDDDLVKFWLKDDGAGLSAADQGKLFVPFNRLNQAQAKGHGLGLSIVQRIMNKLGGKVSVESEVGGGSIFSFYLPLARDKQ